MHICLIPFIFCISDYTVSGLNIAPSWEDMTKKGLLWLKRPSKCDPTNRCSAVVRLLRHHYLQQQSVLQICAVKNNNISIQ